MSDPMITVKESGGAPGRFRKRIVNRNVAVNLTTREREIAKKAAFGMTNKAIAKALGIGESTVKSTVRNIMQKTNITARSDFVMIL